MSLVNNSQLLREKQADKLEFGPPSVKVGGSDEFDELLQSHRLRTLQHTVFMPRNLKWFQFSSFLVSNAVIVLVNICSMN